LLCRFSSAIEAINDRLEQYADGRKQVKFLDCSNIFIENNAKVSISLLIYLQAQCQDVVLFTAPFMLLVAMSVADLPGLCCISARG